MSHIPEGALHAYLDGALEHLDVSESERIRSHLERCAECRERLEEERELRRQATDLLGFVDPAAVAPPFEELRRRALDGPRPGGGPVPPVGRSGPGRAWGLAWAATILLSLGLGWAGRGVWGPRLSPGASGGIEALAERPSMDVVDDARWSSTAARSEARTEASASDVGSTAVETVPPSEEEADASERTRLPSEGGVGGAPEQEQAIGEAQRRIDFATPSTAGAGIVAESLETATDADLRRRQVAQRGLDEEASRKAEAPALRNAAAAEVVAPPPAPTDSPALADQAVAEPANAEREPLAVPGLVILSIEPDPGVPGEPGVRILQRLHQGDTLELRYFGILSDSEARVGAGARTIRMRDLPNPPLESGWNQVVLQRGTGWLVARAPMTRESLEFLLRLLN